MYCETRLPLWAAAVSLWYEHPLIGHGAHNYRDLYRARVDALSLPACSLIDTRLTPWPHNLFLELLSSQGLVGALPFAALVGWGLHRSFAIARQSGPEVELLAVGLFGAFVAFSFAAFVELTLVRYWVVIMAGTLIGLAAAIHFSSSSIQRKPL